VNHHIPEEDDCSTGQPKQNEYYKQFKLHKLLLVVEIVDNVVGNEVQDLCGKHILYPLLAIAIAFNV
jgi:hypothetical protein